MRLDLGHLADPGAQAVDGVTLAGNTKCGVLLRNGSGSNDIGDDIAPRGNVIRGNGDSAGLHTPRYNFNDAILTLGAACWVRLAEASLDSNLI